MQFNEQKYAKYPIHITKSFPFILYNCEDFYKKRIQAGFKSNKALKITIELCYTLITPV